MSQVRKKEAHKVGKRTEKNQKAKGSMGAREKGHTGWWESRKLCLVNKKKVKFCEEGGREKGEEGGQSGSESPVIALTLSWAKV